MSTYKYCNVVMLPAKDQTHQVKQGDLFINDTSKHSWGKLEVLECQRVTSLGHAWNGDGIRTDINHLYITSDDEIKEGDWCINPSKKLLFQVRSIERNRLVYAEGSEKIIATTDRSLRPKATTQKPLEHWIGLPQISKSFIKHLIDSFSTGKTIEEVKVEYEVNAQGCKSYQCNHPLDPDQYNCDEEECESVDCKFLDFRPKVNSDNTINILPIKDSWSRDEVEQILVDYSNDLLNQKYKGNTSQVINQFIKDNLK